MCDRFLEPEGSKELNETMESPSKNLEFWNPGMEQIDFIYL